MIKNILFDMGGVIFRQDSEEAYRRFAAMGIDTDRFMGQYGQKRFFLDLEMGKIDKTEFCRQMAKECNRAIVTEQEASYCWLGYIRDVPLDRLHILESLKKNYHLGLASNTNPFVMDYMDSQQISMDHQPISYYFDSLYCSYTMGLCKPSEEYFNMILSKGNLCPEETLFLDDSAKNIEAAENTGIIGMLIAHNEDWNERLLKYLAKQ